MSSAQPTRSPTPPPPPDLLGERVRQLAEHVDVRRATRTDSALEQMMLAYANLRAEYDGLCTAVRGLASAPPPATAATPEDAG